MRIGAGVKEIYNYYLPMFTYVDSERRPAASMFSSSSVICISADL